MPDESRDECLGKETDRAHFGCCGISLTQADSNTHEACISVPNTQAGKGLFSEIEKIVGKDSEAKFEFKCPEANDKIEGTCQDFKEVLVNDVKECLNLTQKEGVKDHSCCGVKAKLEFNQKGISASLPINFWTPIPTNETDKEALVKKLLNETGGYMTFESLECQSDNTHLKIYIC